MTQEENKQILISIAKNVRIPKGEKRTYSRLRYFAKNKIKNVVSLWWFMEELTFFSSVILFFILWNE